MKTALPSICTRIDVTEYGSTWQSTNGKWFYTDHMANGDYVDSCSRSNARVFAEQFSESEGTWWQWAGSVIAIRTLAYRNIEVVRDLIDGLAEYPILDEDDHSRLEQEDEEENWNSWGRAEFRLELARTIETLTDDSEEVIGGFSDGSLDTLFYKLCQEEETYPEHTGGEVHFPIKDVVEAWDGMIDGEPVLPDHKPVCKRCGVDCTTNRVSLWHGACENPVCDIPTPANTVNAKLAYAALKGDKDSLLVIQDALGGVEAFEPTNRHIRHWYKTSVKQTYTREVLKHIAING